jgi:hypothetical protein
MASPGGPVACFSYLAAWLRRHQVRATSVTEGGLRTPQVVVISQPGDTGG